MLTTSDRAPIPGPKRRRWRTSGRGRLVCAWFSGRGTMRTQCKSAGAATRSQGTQTSLLCPVARSVALDEELKPAAAISDWLSALNADDFPYDAVVAEFRQFGKHVVSTELLEALAGVRAVMSEVRGSVTSVRLLDRFL